MATFDLGRVTPLYKGDYSASTSYELNDVVLYNGNLYWHVQATATVGILPTDTTVWKLAFADEGVRAEIRGYADDAQASADSALSSKTAAAQSVSQASASASQAALSAQAAGTSEGNASASASAAATSATNSAASAQSAASSAQTATDKAALATNKAQAASESASLATAKASAAATSETNAAASAQTATTKASEAAASATSAQEYDESAQQSAVNAQTAQGLAETAQTAAETAQGLAETAQGLAETAQTAAETAQTAAETAQGLAEDARDDAQEIVDGINAKASQIDANTASIVTLEEDCYKPYAVDTASGAIASFADGADDIPLKSLVVNIDPVQSGSGDPSPDNVRPISGRTGMTVNANGQTIPINWQSEAGTVYGGSLDVLSGVLTVDRAMVDMGTLNWVYFSNKQRFAAQVNSGKPAGINAGFDGACSVYKVVNTRYHDMPDKSILIGNNFISDPYAAMVVFDSAYTDAETFKTAVSGQTLVFPIKNPIVYQLTPTEVKSLLGQNNIFADTGDSSVEYRADTKLYIERLTEPDADMIADANIVSGQYFMVGNSLYLATSNIASGGQVIVGTNATRKSLSEALNEINQ